MDLRAKERRTHRPIHGPGESTAKSPSKALLTQGMLYFMFTTFAGIHSFTLIVSLNHNFLAKSHANYSLSLKGGNNWTEEC